MRREPLFDQEKNRELKEAFLQHLPERIANLQNDWKTLCRGEWNAPKMENLFLKIQELSGSSGRFGLIDLSESTLSLEAYLSSFLESGSPKKKEHIDKANELFNILNQAVKNTIPRKAQFGQTEKLVFFLRPSDQTAPGLSAALESRGCSLITFADILDATAELQKRLPDILIVSGEFLPMVGEMSRVLTIEQAEQERSVSLICIGDSNSLEQRLRAFRMGVDAYYLPPLDIHEIVERALELTEPKEENHRILVVEDDPAQAKFAASILEKGGMTTHSVTDPLKVLDALDEFRPDLILMDLYMPNANGTELTAIIREHPDFIATPVVFLSGEHDADKKLEALSTGGDDFLTKPIRPRQLISTISNRVKRAETLTSKALKQGARDPVSGLFHRRHFFQQLDNIIARHQRQPVIGAVIYLTLPTRNKSGAEDGRVEKSTRIALLGTLITEQLEEQDIATRIDDNNFAILITRPHEKNIQSMVEKLAEMISKQDSDDSQSLLTHFGIAPFNQETSDAAGTLAKAIKAASSLEPQTSGIAFFSATGKENKRIGEVQTLIRDAWEKQSIQLLYQPVKTSKNLPLEQYHVSLRLLTDTGSAIDESEFHNAAAEAGLMESINHWLLESALSSLAEKRAEGKQVTLFINQMISTDKQQQDVYISWLIDQLRSRQIVGAGLVLEYRIAELGSDIRGAKHFLSRLQELGIQISLSRFAANKAALTVLQYLKADYVCLASQLLKVNAEAARNIVDQIHKSGAKVIIPTTDSTGAAPTYWANLADMSRDRS